MHFQCDIAGISRFESSFVVCKLFGVDMLREEFVGHRGFRFLGFLLIAVAGMSSAMTVSARNVLSADFYSAKRCNLVSVFQIIDICVLFEDFNREYKTVRLFAAKINGFDVSLVRIKIPAGIVSVCILQADEVVFVCEFFAELSVRWKINDALADFVGEIDDYIISEDGRNLQSVCVAVFAEVVDCGYVCAVCDLDHFLYINGFAIGSRNLASLLLW